MAVRNAVAMRACERVFARLCELGSGVDEGTPAAGFLAAAARRVDAARAHLSGPSVDVERALDQLTHAAGLLNDVSELSGRKSLSGLERLSVLVDGLRVTLQVDEHGNAIGSDGPDEEAAG